jgi:chromosome segregation protein
LKKQCDDVEKSRTELMSLIRELTSQMKQLFAESFEKINQNFQKIFEELFLGGKASLTLTDPDNILESGIDINVQPPGKIIKNLSSLSGGEKAFVAIAIYFAILKVRPSPFCMLDEIEAALDEVNVSRYARYLKNLSDHTQFIAITHRRGTMEEADIMYGVTMQEKGVSKLLELDISQVESRLGMKSS